MLYLDTSALAKLYIIESEGQGVESLVTEHESELFTSITTYAEVLSALARCFREKRISRQGFEDQRRAFLHDWSALHVVDVRPRFWPLPPI
jgi:predicted nucleic acid-binding protein